MNIATKGKKHFAKVPRKYQYKNKEMCDMIINETNTNQSSNEVDVRNYRKLCGLYYNESLHRLMFFVSNIYHLFQRVYIN